MTAIPLSVPSQVSARPAAALRRLSFTFAGDGSHAACLAASADGRWYVESWRLGGGAAEPVALLPSGAGTVRSESLHVQLISLPDGRVLICRHEGERHELVVRGLHGQADLSAGTLLRAGVRLLPLPVTAPGGPVAVALGTDGLRTTVWLVSADGVSAPQEAAMLPGLYGGGVWLDRGGRTLALDQLRRDPLGGRSCVKTVALDLATGEFHSLLELAPGSNDRLVAADPVSGLILVRSDAPGEDRLGWGVLGSDAPPRFPDCLRGGRGFLRPIALEPQPPEAAGPGGGTTTAARLGGGLLGGGRLLGGAVGADVPSAGPGRAGVDDDGGRAAYQEYLAVYGDDTIELGRGGLGLGAARDLLGRWPGGGQTYGGQAYGGQTYGGQASPPVAPGPDSPAGQPGSGQGWAGPHDAYAGPGMGPGTGPGVAGSSAPGAWPGAGYGSGAGHGGGADAGGTGGPGRSGGAVPYPGPGRLPGPIPAAELRVAIQCDWGAVSTLAVWQPSSGRLEPLELPPGRLGGVGHWSAAGLRLPYSAPDHPAAMATVDVDLLLGRTAAPTVQPVPLRLAPLQGGAAGMRSLLRVVPAPVTEPGWRLDGSATPDGGGRWRTAQVAEVPGAEGPLEAVVYGGEGWLTADRLVLALHGGPADAWRLEFDPTLQRLAAAGMAVLAPNQRGSTGYGVAHAEAVQGAWGGPDLDDLLALLHHLGGQRQALGLPPMALFGVGYGAFLALLAACTAPERVSRCAVVAPFLSGARLAAEADEQVRALVERMGAAAPLADGRGPRDVLALCHRLTAETLIVHGDRDAVVPVGQSRTLRQELLRIGRVEGVDFRYVEAAGAGHEVLAEEGGPLLTELLTEFLGAPPARSAPFAPPVGESPA